jgi:hypothetical protein
MRRQGRDRRVLVEQLRGRGGLFAERIRGLPCVVVPLAMGEAMEGRKACRDTR